VVNTTLIDIGIVLTTFSLYSFLIYNSFRMNIKTLFIVICLFIMNNISAQEGQHINLYEGTVFNSIPSNLKEEELSNGRVTHITEPELIVYFPAKQDSLHTSVIICPGGGYARLAMNHEGHDVAKALNKMGITAFVLKYRVPNDTCMKDKSIVPLADAQQAIYLVRQNAVKWNINPSKVGIMGFSAGGHLAASLSTLYSYNLHNYNDSISLRPDFSVLVYPVISFRDSISHSGSKHRLIGEHPTEEMTSLFSCNEQVTNNTPPAFLMVANDDKTVPVINSKVYYDALLKHKVPAEIYISQNGGHAFGLYLPDHFDWTANLKRWLQANKMLSK
jgi:acetyl esterase/lipase